jgi:hypothetical protein
MVDTGTADNLLLTIAISGSLVILAFLLAFVYITIKKRELRQLFDDFTDQQEIWVQNRVAERLREFSDKSQFKNDTEATPKKYTDSSLSTPDVFSSQMVSHLLPREIDTRVSPVEVKPSI